MKKSITSALLILLTSVGVGAATRNPGSNVLSLRLGMEEESAHRRLRKIATQQREEKDGEKEGEQEVWLLRDRRLAYVVLRFDHKHKLWFMIAVVRQGSRVLYSELADLKSATQATDGRNYTYTWNVNRGTSEPGYVVVARGSDPNYLTSYSISRTF